MSDDIRKEAPDESEAEESDIARIVEQANEFYEDKDFKKAFELYQKAAEAGDSDAMYSLGQMYRYGEGFKQSYAKAKEWYQKSAEAGNALAMRTLYRSYTVMK